MEHHENPNTLAKLIGLGIILIMVGFAIIFISTVLMAFQHYDKINVSGGVLVVLGFIPIGFAFGPHSEIIMIVLLILALVIMVLGFILRKAHV